MATHDYDIANQSGANFRTDLNNCLDAIVSNNSSGSEPATTFAYMWWVDTGNNVLKLRNSANNAWITLPMSITASNTITPTLNMGTGAEEDVKIVFDGNAQDYYIGLDDSADDLIIGKGSTVGTTPAISIDENLKSVFGGTVDVNGNELILDADADTSITADTDDQIDFKTGGSDRLTLDASGNLGVATTSPSQKLEVAGNIFINTSGNPNLTVKTSGAGNNPFVRIQADSNYWDLQTLFSNANDELDFRYNGTSKLMVSNSGDIGIGTTNPQQLLEISGSSDPRIRINNSTTALSAGTSIGGIEYQTNDASTGGTGVGASIEAIAEGAFGSNQQGVRLSFKTRNSGASETNSERMRISSAGAFYLYDIIGFGGANSDVRYDTSSGQIYYQTSSERYKSEITNLEDSLNKIESLRPVRFKDNHTQEFTTGLIAEEVVNIIPEVVFKKDIDGFDEPQPEGINYSDITPFLIKAIQEQQTIIDDLKTRIETLEGA